MKIYEIYKKYKIHSYKPTNLANMSIEEIIRTSGCLHEGHTEFRNGLHGNGWLEKDIIVRNPKYLDRVSQLQSQQILKEFPKVDLLLGAITGGAIIVSYVAKHLGTEFGIILGKQNPIVFHGMNIPEKGEKVVLAEDIISSGVDMERFVNFLKQSGTDVIGISVWMNRKDNEIAGIRVIDLLTSPYELYEKENCPLCKDNIPILFSNVRE